MLARIVAIPLLLLSAPAAWASPAVPVATESLRLICDAINISGLLDRATSRDLEPAHSLDAAAEVLDKHKIKYTRGKGIMTISDAPSAMIRQIYQLPQGEPIVLPNGEDTTICVPRPSADSI
jgi:hypothetical protein